MPGEAASGLVPVVRVRKRWGVRGPGKNQEVGDAQPSPVLPRGRLRGERLPQKEGRRSQNKTLD